jgi:predicted nucleic acid-binding Zn ribbon protein
VDRGFGYPVYHQGEAVLDRRHPESASIVGLRRCDGCGQPFDPIRPGQRVCRPSCRALARQKQTEHRRGALFPGLESGPQVGPNAAG